jgi:hypothetical protein
MKEMKEKDNKEVKKMRERVSVGKQSILTYVQLLRFSVVCWSCSSVPHNITSGASVTEYIMLM